MTVARARPLPRSNSVESPKRSEESAIREFGFGSEPPTIPHQDVELLIERAIAESGEFPLGWSIAPPGTETPTLLRPPSEEDIELCASRRTPILPIDAFSFPDQAQVSWPEIALHDPGPPIPSLGVSAFSQRPTAPPTPAALSQRPTLAAKKPLSRRPPIDPFLEAPHPSPSYRVASTYHEPERELPAVEYLGREPPPSAKVETKQPPKSKLRPGAIRVLMDEDQIRELPLNHRAGFVLSMVGLVQTVDELLDISGMSRSEAMRLLCDLVDLGAIDLG